MSETAPIASFAASTLYKLAHLGFEKTRCLSQLGLAVSKTAIWIVANSIPLDLSTHAGIRQVGLFSDLRRVMGKSAFGPLLALALLKKLAHFRLDKLHMVFLLDIRPCFTSHVAACPFASVWAAHSRDS